MRPTAEDILWARETLLPMPPIEGNAFLNEEGQQAVAILLAATAPVRDDEITKAAWEIADSAELQEALDGCGRESFYVKGFRDGVAYTNLHVVKHRTGS